MSSFDCATRATRAVVHSAVTSAHVDLAHEIAYSWENEREFDAHTLQVICMDLRTTLHDDTYGDACEAAQRAIDSMVKDDKDVTPLVLHDAFVRAHAAALRSCRPAAVDLARRAVDAARVHHDAVRTAAVREAVESESLESVDFVPDSLQNTQQLPQPHAEHTEHAEHTLLFGAQPADEPVIDPNDRVSASYLQQVFDSHRGVLATRKRSRVTVTGVEVDEVDEIVSASTQDGDEDA